MSFTENSISIQTKVQPCGYHKDIALLFLLQESPCKESNYSVGATIDSFMKVAPNNAKALMKAIAMYGPATASINTEAKTLKFYKHGIYNDKMCSEYSSALFPKVL